MCVRACACVPGTVRLWGRGRQGGALLGLQSPSCVGRPCLCWACHGAQKPVSAGQSGRWRGATRHWHGIRKTGPPAPRTPTPHLVLVLVLGGADLPSNLCFPSCRYWPILTCFSYIFSHFSTGLFSAHVGEPGHFMSDTVLLYFALGSPATRYGQGRHHPCGPPTHFHCVA